MPEEPTTRDPTEEKLATLGKPMLIDRLMHSYNAMRAEHRIVPGNVATVYAATRRADFIRLAGVRRRPAAVCCPRGQ